MYSSAKPFKGQKYSSLRKKCQSEGQLFKDSLFPATDASLYRSGSSTKQGAVQWKRPKEICEDPRLFVGGTSVGDVEQGRLGNCWLVAATACIASHKSSWKKIIPNSDDQEWDPKTPEKYCGIFCFRFYHHGDWVDVVIDDLLPTIGGKLIYMHSQTPNEFWSALLEKAYAKVFGCYEELDGGGLEEALVDFTGGIAESIGIRDEGYDAEDVKRHDLFELLTEEIKNKSLMAAAIPATGAEDMEASTPEGLVKGHAYSITNVKAVALAGSGFLSLFRKEHLPMVKLRNPWGRFEWKGAFSDASTEWNKVSKAERRKLGVDVEDDGEFWMLFDDFCKHFVQLTVCRVLNTSWLSVSKTYTESRFRDEWKTPSRAGGCVNNKTSYLQNPQFAFSVTKETDNVLVSLEQCVDNRSSEKPAIGFHVMMVEENRISRLHEKQKVVSSSIFKNSRSVFGRFELVQGRYVVLPCTFEPGIERRFLLRVYTGQSMNSRALTMDHPSKAICCGLCVRPYLLATRVQFVNASGLPASSSGARLYLVVRCEGQTVKIPACNAEEQQWTWDRSVLFFRTSGRSPIQVLVMDEKPITDKFMGQFTINSSGACELEATSFALKPKKEGDVPVAGAVVAAVTTRRDLDTF